MAKASDFVYLQVYRGALKAGARESIAKDHAVRALDAYRKGKFSKALDLITMHINTAKAESRRI